MWIIFGIISAVCLSAAIDDANNHHPAPSIWIEAIVGFIFLIAALVYFFS